MERLIMKILNTVNAFLSLVVILLSLIEYELHYFTSFFKERDLIKEAKENKIFEKDNLMLQNSYKGMTFRVTESVLCFFSVIIGIIVNYKTYSLRYQQRKIVADRFIKSSQFFIMLMEIIINAVHPIPYYDYFFTFKSMGVELAYRLQVFLYAFTFLKLYPILNLITIYSKYANLETEKICEESGMELNTIFVLKAFQKDHPFTILTITLIVVSIFFGTILRYFELLNGIDGAVQYRFYLNGIWNIIVAMTLVGYGDYFPKSHIGRVILVFGVLIGTVIISLTVVALNGIISFDDNEQKAFEILNRIYLRNKLNDACQKIIFYNFKIKLMKKTIDFRDLNESKDYAFLVRNLKKETQLKLFISKKMQAFSLNKDKDKFVDLEEKINDCIVNIHKNFDALRDFRRKIKWQNKNQILLISNMQKTLKITKDYIKPLLQKLVIKHNVELLDTEMLVKYENINDVEIPKMEKDVLKLCAIKEMEKILFEIDPKIMQFYVSQDFLNYKKKYLTKSELVMLQRINIGLLSKDQIIQNIIEKNRNNYTEFYLDYLKNEEGKKTPLTRVSKYRLSSAKIKSLAENESEDKKAYLNYMTNDNVQNQNEAEQASIETEGIITQYFENDPVNLELEKFTQLNTQTKNFIAMTSPNSLNLFFALASLKRKELYLDEIKEKDRIDFINKEDIMDSLCELYYGKKSKEAEKEIIFNLNQNSFRQNKDIENNNNNNNNHQLLSSVKRHETQENNVLNSNFNEYLSPDKKSLKLIKYNYIEDANNYLSSDQNRLITDNNQRDSNEVLHKIRRKGSYVKDLYLSTEEPLNLNKSKADFRNNKKTNYDSNYVDIYTTLNGNQSNRNNVYKNNLKNSNQKNPFISNNNNNADNYSNYAKTTFVKFNSTIEKEKNLKETRSVNFLNNNNNLISDNVINNNIKNDELDPLERYNQYIKTVYEIESKRNKEDKKVDLMENHKKKIAFLEETSSKISKNKPLNKNNNINNFDNANDNFNNNPDETGRKLGAVILNNQNNSKQNNYKNQNTKGFNKPDTVSSRNDYNILNKENIEKFKNFDNLYSNKNANNYNIYDNDYNNNNENNEINRDNYNASSYVNNNSNSISREPTKLLFNNSNNSGLAGNKGYYVVTDNSKLDFEKNNNSIRSLEIIKNAKMQNQNNRNFIEKPGSLRNTVASSSSKNFLKDSK